MLQHAHVNVFFLTLEHMLSHSDTDFRNMQQSTRRRFKNVMRGPLTLIDWVRFSLQAVGCCSSNDHHRAGNDPALQLRQNTKQEAAQSALHHNSFKSIIVLVRSNINVTYFDSVA